MKLRLREWRERGGVSYRDLAKRAGVALSSIQRAETGQASPTIQWLGKVAAALDLDIHDLLPPRRKGTPKGGRHGK